MFIARHAESSLSAQCCRLLHLLTTPVWRHGLTPEKPLPVNNATPHCAPKSRKVWDDNWQVYGGRKGEPLKAPLVQAQWQTRQLCREGAEEFLPVGQFGDDKG